MQEHRELAFAQRNEAVAAEITLRAELAAVREAVRKIRATDNITAVWHIADAALQGQRKTEETK